MQRVINISVPTARITSDAKPFTLYDVTITLPLRTYQNSKRYSEFVDFHQALIAQAASAPPVPLPPKHYFASTTKDGALTEARRAGLECYLQAISHSADPKWRDTTAWRGFLNLPSSISSKNVDVRAPGRNGTTNTSSDPAIWLDLYRELKGTLHEARSLVTQRAQSEGSTAGHEANVAAKPVLARADSLLARLEDGLRNRQDEWARERLGEGELRRRKDLLAASREEKEDLRNLMAAMARKKQIDKVIEDSQALRGPAAETNHSRAATKLGRGRVLGRETSKTRELDNTGVLELQKQIMVEQDEDINTIADAVRRQKQLAVQINEELTVQNEMLSFLAEGVTRVDDKIKAAGKKVDKIR